MGLSQGIWHVQTALADVQTLKASTTRISDDADAAIATRFLAGIERSLRAALVELGKENDV